MFDELGDYKILERIGAGGLGQVYHAPDAVAGDADRRARLTADAQAAAALSHPNIAALYEVGEDRGHLFLAGEFVPGDALKTATAGQAMNARHAAEHGAQIADALAEAHAAGVVHGDIKP